MALTLTPDERSELQRRVRSRKIRAEDARRARVILMLARGDSFNTIATAIGCYPDYISRWKQRFQRCLLSRRSLLRQHHLCRGDGQQ